MILTTWQTNFLMAIILACETIRRKCKFKNIVDDYEPWYDSRGKECCAGIVSQKPPRLPLPYFCSPYDPSVRANPLTPLRPLLGPSLCLLVASSFAPTRAPGHRRSFHTSWMCICKILSPSDLLPLLLQPSLQAHKFVEAGHRNASMHCEVVVLA